LSQDIKITPENKVLHWSLSVCHSRRFYKQHILTSMCKKELQCLSCAMVQVCEQFSYSYLLYDCKNIYVIELWHTISLFAAKRNQDDLEIEQLDLTNKHLRLDNVRLEAETEKLKLEKEVLAEQLLCFRSIREMAVAGKDFLDKKSFVDFRSGNPFLDNVFFNEKQIRSINNVSLT